MAGADDKTQITIRVPVEVHSRLQRLFHLEGGYSHGGTFRTFVAAFLDETSAVADSQIEMVKRAIEAVEREPPPPPPLPKKK